MGAVVHDGGHAAIVVLGLIIVGVLALVAWIRDKI